VDIVPGVFFPKLDKNIRTFEAMINFTLSELPGPPVLEGLNQEHEHQNSSSNSRSSLGALLMGPRGQEVWGWAYGGAVGSARAGSSGLGVPPGAIPGEVLIIVLNGHYGPLRRWR